MAKHFDIFETLVREIEAGKYNASRRLPSENQLGRRFSVSRPTVAQAIRELHRMGLVERTPGSGTYLKQRPDQGERLLALLVPGLGNTEIFEPICAELARQARGREFGLLWGDLQHQDLETRSREAEAICREYIGRRVSGVFLAPLELTADSERINRRIVQRLNEAHIPVVLLDRDLVPFPGHSHFDCVGLDNFEAGYKLASHLADNGCRRLVFFLRPKSAPTLQARIAGCRTAALDRKGSLKVCEEQPDNAGAVRSLLKRDRPDAIVCGNDLTAVTLLRTLEELKVRVPADLSIAEFDDVRYASVVSVPLTTIRQPCRAIGEMAFHTMLQRIEYPALAGRQILLPGDLVVPGLHRVKPVDSRQKSVDRMWTPFA